MKVLFSTMLALFLLGAYSFTNTQKQVSHPDSDGYKLVWADEFNTNGPPDNANWSFENGFERNEELQWYQPGNAWCQNGVLIIEGRREVKPNPNYVAGSDDWKKNREQITYTSSGIKTRGKQAWLYGRFVMRGKIDISPGLWPAWWTIGNAGHWPGTGEIDIMEYYRKKLLANIVCLGADNQPEWHSSTKNTDTLGGKAWADRFHIWRMDWDQKEIALYVDDILMLKADINTLANKSGNQTNPFKQPHYMLLNLAIGGQQGGNPSPTKFPARFEVDYVRVYQKQ